MGTDKKSTKPYQIQFIINELKDTVQTLDEFLMRHGWSDYKKQIEKEIYDQQEIGQCVNCDSWEELGEFNSIGECAGCDSLDEDGGE